MPQHILINIKCCGIVYKVEQKYIIKIGYGLRMFHPNNIVMPILLSFLKEIVS